MQIEDPSAEYYQSLNGSPKKSLALIGGTVLAFVLGFVLISSGQNAQSVRNTFVVSSPSPTLYQSRYGMPPPVQTRKPTSVPIVSKPAVNSASPATWVRVDTDMRGATCDDFCATNGKSCSTNACAPDALCHATGGMMEVETWNWDVGPVCDRTWPGKCGVPIDRYPPSFNFYCCCQ